ncbi:MAG: hypothetical protein QKB75_gp6 [Bacilladnaviridae sp.]|uniref:Uncharacterized protein n=1 Tax=Bacilladnaviridae sp. isolate ctia23 TaxID=3070178 RepID=A0A345N326_9VIRU|nr:MAG: hypothetical protein QKB75_gp6 [Bacilladnaviridae sp.]AXH78026.1 MAG: hypothetical protein [Bacilladnaviridae sp. isolate ctia23]
MHAHLMVRSGGAAASLFLHRRCRLLLRSSSALHRTARGAARCPSLRSCFSSCHDLQFMFKLCVIYSIFFFMSLRWYKLFFMPSPPVAYLGSIRTPPKKATP